MQDRTNTLIASNDLLERKHSDLTGCFPREKVVIEDIEIYGFKDARSLMNRMIYEIREYKGSPFIINNVNVHLVNSCCEDPQLKEAVIKAELKYADGMGIVLASKLLDSPIPNRITAADWILDLLRLFAEQNLTVGFLASTPDVVDRAIGVFNDQVPENSIAFYHHGYIHKDPELEEQVIQAINVTKPDLLVVGFGTPLQEKWAIKNAHRLKVKTIITLGAVLDYYAGEVKRCPAWVGQIGFEWLFRLLQEPQRLFRRYIHGNPWFLFRIVKSMLLK